MTILKKLVSLGRKLYLFVCYVEQVGLGDPDEQQIYDELEPETLEGSPWVGQNMSKRGT